MKLTSHRHDYISYFKQKSRYIFGKFVDFPYNEGSCDYIFGDNVIFANIYIIGNIFHFIHDLLLPLYLNFQRMSSLPTLFLIADHHQDISEILKLYKNVRKFFIIFLLCTSEM